jgi:hypothetical protein
VFILVFVGAGVWLYRQMFPPAEERIRGVLREAAGTASFGSDSGNLARLAAIHRLGAYFTPDAEIVVDMPGAASHRVMGRDEVRQIAAGMRSAVQGLEVRLMEMDVRMEPGGRGARVHVVVSVRVDGAEEVWISEFKLLVVDVEGDWLIRRVDPVKSLQM